MLGFLVQKLNLGGYFIIAGLQTHKKKASNAEALGDASWPSMA
jgi:hypothetical protein